MTSQGYTRDQNDNTEETALICCNFPTKQVGLPSFLWMGQLRMTMHRAQTIFTRTSALFILTLTCNCSGGQAHRDPVADAGVTETEAPCTPLCQDRQCGDDGCGGSCGSCFNVWGGVAPELCTATGQCCQQDCTGKLCGDDGCGGVCGVCDGPAECIEGSCEVTPGWTVLIYAMGDNDLEGSMLAQFNQLMTVGSNENLNIIVQVDYVEGMGSRPGNWKEQDLVIGQRLRIKAGEVEVLEEMEEFNSADPAVLADFIAWGVTHYPARRYALILDDHGGGYTGIGSDWTNGGWMPVPAIAAGLEEGLNATTLDRFDILFYYACLMGNYEVAHNMAPYTRYMLASEELAIGASFRLDELKLAHDDGAVDAHTLAWAMAKDYVPTWSKAYPGVTISLLDLDQLDEFETALGQVLDSFRDDLTAVIGDLMVARHQSEMFASLPFGFNSMQLVDLGGIFSVLATRRPDLAPTIEPLMKAYQALVVENDSGPGHPNATGLSVFFPPSYDYYFEENPYNGSSTGKEYEFSNPPVLWQGFLVEALEKVSLADLGPQFGCFSGDENPICQDQSGWLTEGADSFSLKRPVFLETLADDFAAFFVFAELPKYGMAQVDFYTQVPVAIDGQTGMVDASYDYRRVVLHQGDKESFAYWQLTDGPDGRTIAIPFLYLDPQSEHLETLEWQASLLPDSFEVLEAHWWLRTADQTLVPFEPGADGKVYPAVQRLDMEWHTFGWESLFTAFDPALPITLSYDLIDPCKAYLYGLVVEDSVGRSDLIFANICKANGDPKLKITVTVKADPEVIWDPSNAPDFAITLELGGVMTPFAPVADSQEAVFELTVDYTRWMSGKLSVREVDGNYHTDLLSKDITDRLYYADWFCNHGKKWTLQEVKDGPKTTIHLNVSKCF